MSGKEAPFFIFEGIGGSGKSTQIELAVKYLEEKGIKVIKTREPGGVPAAEGIRKLIFDWRKEGLINAGEQMVLFFTSRSFWVEGCIKPARAEGIAVLSDRSFPSTGAYQGFAEGGDLGKIEQMAKKVMGENMPNAIILLDVSPEVAQARRYSEKNGDPFDGEELEYFNKVVNGYRTMAQLHWCGVPWYVVDGEKPIEAVAQNIRIYLDEILND